MKAACCEKPGGKFRPDCVLHGSLLVIFVSSALHYAGVVAWRGLDVFAATQIALLGDMAWGLAFGLVCAGLMNRIPREYFTVLLGRGDSFGGIVRAALAGMIFDLCNHGVLVIAGKLYERGLSLAQVLTFLIATPWNSLSLTFILIALIGLPWTLAFIAASMLVAVISGLVYRRLARRRLLPQNPNARALPADFDLRADARTRLKGWRPSPGWIRDIARDGWRDGRMIIRWILFGTIIAAALRAYVPAEIFGGWFGPTIAGLGVTLLAATLIEICSEGSTPIAAEIINGAGAPGNGFAFLMAGVATDYTEILAVREFARSWLIALSIPLVTLPQIIILGLLFNL